MKAIPGVEGNLLTESFVKKFEKLPGIMQWYEQTTREYGEEKKGVLGKFDFPGKNLAMADVFTNDASVESFKSAIREFKKELERKF